MISILQTFSSTSSLLFVKEIMSENNLRNYSCSSIVIKFSTHLPETATHGITTSVQLCYVSTTGTSKRDRMLTRGALGSGFVKISASISAVLQ